MQVIYDSVTFGLIVVKTASAVLNERGHSDVRALIVIKRDFFTMREFLSRWLTYQVLSYRFLIELFLCIRYLGHDDNIFSGQYNISNSSSYALLPSSFPFGWTQSGLKNAAEA